MNWRPSKNWKPDPCRDCERKRTDQWGLICDIACGEHSAYRNYEAGANAMLEAIKKLTNQEQIDFWRILKEV